MRTLSLQLCENSSHQNNGGIIRNNTFRSSIRIAPPIAPPSDVSKSPINANPSQQLNSSQIKQSDIRYVHSLPAENASQMMQRPLNTFCMSYDSNNYFAHTNGAKVHTDKLSQSQYNSFNPKLPPNNLPIVYVNYPQIGVANNIARPIVASEDQSGDIGRKSPSDSGKSRYSSTSLDSGRGSDAKVPQFKRISVHSCDSIGSSSSHKDGSTRNSSSSSSLGSGISSAVEVDTSNISTPTKSTSGSSWSTGSNGSLTIAEMVLHGIADNEIIHAWLTSIHYEEYVPHFLHSGYDMPTISRMTPEDLTAIGITKPSHRRILKTEIQKLNIADGIPHYKPNSLLEWLKILRLEEYFHILCQQGYDSIDRVTELAWEDLEEVGIKKLGHQKKMMLAIKKIENIKNDVRYSSCNDVPPMTPLHHTNVGSCPEIISRPSANCYQLPIQAQCHDVPIKMCYPPKQMETLNTPQLKTFQQLPLSANTGFMFQRQHSEGPLMNMMHSDGQNHTFQASRGRSLESLEYNDTCFRHNLYEPMNQRNSYNPCIMPNQQLTNETFTFLDNGRAYHGYETDSEVMKNQNHRYSDGNHLYEFDGTATLHRPKGLIKTRPIAKIAAKTRQSSDPWITVNPQQSTDMLMSEKLHMTDEFQKPIVNCDGIFHNSNMSMGIHEPSSPSLMTTAVPSNQIYATLKRRKTPPPPPKRSNSIRNNTRNFTQSSNENISDMRSPIDDIQDQAFATCVKSLASRFSIGNTQKSPPPLVHHNDNSSRMSKPIISNECEFPPPPSPLLCNSECYGAKDQFFSNSMQLRKDFNDRESNISSSSSTESMPFANDNIGTIKYKESSSFNNHHSSIVNSPTLSLSPSEEFKGNGYKVMVNHSLKNSPQRDVSSANIVESFSSKRKGNEIRDKPCNAQREVNHHANKCHPHQNLDPLDDIETMLVNLSNQLDLMLDNEKKTE